jgi:hypothetical protein
MAEVSEVQSDHPQLESECMALVVMDAIARQIDTSESFRAEVRAALNAKLDAFYATGGEIHPFAPDILKHVAEGIMNAYSACRLSVKADIHAHRISSIKQVEDGTLEAKCDKTTVTEGNPVFKVSGDLVGGPGRPTKFIFEASHV